MQEASRIYLDNAATSFPKPPAVYEAMLRYGTRIGASPGRGHYAESREGAKLIRQCRERLNRLINGESADHIVFALNTSDALNLAIKGIARHRRRQRPGEVMELITTAMDHNSVLRPFAALAEDGARLIHIDVDPVSGAVDPAAIAVAITPRTALVAVNMASNVTGIIQPVAEIGAICRGASVPYLVDAAQSLGHVPVDVRGMNIDLLAFPGHKGLLGPQGTGGLYIRPGIERMLATTREGGTGSLSEQDVQPDSMPEKYEAGSHNTIGIVGLSEAAAYLLAQGMDAVRAHELALIEFVLADLREGGCRLGDAESGGGPLRSLRLLGPAAASERVGVFSFVHESLAPAEIAVILEQQFRILARSGITCAPRAHAALGTLAAQGAVRLSIGPFTTTDHLRAAGAALREICASVGDSPRVATGPVGLQRA